MPNGTIHNRSIVALAVVLPVATLAGGLLPAGRALALSAGCLAGLLISPDLDIDRGNISYKIIRRSMGCLPGILWKLFWLPYARLIPHRSWMSHGLVIGTLLRLAYLLCVPAVLWGMTSMVLPLPALSAPHWTWLPFAILGLIAADALHSILDLIWR